MLVSRAILVCLATFGADLLLSNVPLVENLEAALNKALDEKLEGKSDVKLDINRMMGGFGLPSLWGKDSDPFDEFLEMKYSPAINANPSKLKETFSPVYKGRANIKLMILVTLKKETRLEVQRLIRAMCENMHNFERSRRRDEKFWREVVLVFIVDGMENFEATAQDFFRELGVFDSEVIDRGLEEENALTELAAANQDHQNQIEGFLNNLPKEREGERPSEAAKREREAAAAGNGAAAAAAAKGPAKNDSANEEKNLDAHL